MNSFYTNAQRARAVAYGENGLISEYEISLSTAKSIKGINCIRVIDDKINQLDVYSYRLLVIQNKDTTVFTNNGYELTRKMKDAISDIKPPAILIFDFIVGRDKKEETQMLEMIEYNIK